MRSAVVVGAGVGGLAAAGALARSGWHVTLLERAERLRADPAALLLWPNGVRALHALGIAHGLDAISWPVAQGGIRRPGGQWMVQPQAAAGPGPTVVHREDLHDALVAGLGEQMDIRTGVTVRSVLARPEDRPAVSDGRHTWEADLIVAADGVDSGIRSRLAPDARVVSSGCAAWRAVIPWYRAPKLPSEQQSPGVETLGDGYRFRYALLGERGSAGGASTRGGIYWTATAVGASRPEPPATQLTLLRRWFAGWHEPIAELLAATEPDDLVQHGIRELKPLPSAYAFPAGPGGVVLLGDAAHAMPHHLAQGACLAFEDAATLQSVMREAIPGERIRVALDTYSRDRRARAARVLKLSHQVGGVLQARGRLIQRARNASLSVLSPRLLDRAATTAAQWEPSGV